MRLAPCVWLLRRGLRKEYGTASDPSGRLALAAEARLENRSAAQLLVAAGVPDLMIFTPVFVVGGFGLGALIGGVVEWGASLGLALGLWPGLAMAVKGLRSLLPKANVETLLASDALELAMALPLALALAWLAPI